MEITKSQKRLFIFLGIVLAYGVFDFFSNMDTYMSFYTAKEEEPILTVTQEDSSKNVLEEKEVEYLADWGQDPFHISMVVAKAGVKAKNKYIPKLKLYAISYKGAESAALINDKFLKVGGMIAGYHLIHIKKNEVTLSDGKKTLKLKLVKY